MPPFQPSVAHHTDRFVLLISSSKVFSYAGERIGMLVVSDAIWNTRAPDLKRYYPSDSLGYAMVFGAIYALSSGTSHSAQYALAAVLKAVNDGELNFVDGVREYGEKAHVMKRLFTDNGFRIVYDTDLDAPIADGFYFTFSYPGLTGEDTAAGTAVLRDQRHRAGHHRQRAHGRPARLHVAHPAVRVSHAERAARVVPPRPSGVSRGLTQDLPVSRLAGRQGRRRPASVTWSGCTYTPPTQQVPR